LHTGARAEVAVESIQIDGAFEGIQGAEKRDIIKEAFLAAAIIIARKNT
jgi:hypothetical protein